MKRDKFSGAVCRSEGGGALEGVSPCRPAPPLVTMEMLTSRLLLQRIKAVRSRTPSPASAAPPPPHDSHRE